MMLATRLIERKRDGGRLEPGDWHALSRAYAAGHIPDYQMAAFLMACYLRGLDRAETAALTEAMLGSGATLDLSHLPAPRIDKHSTGDSIPLIAASIMSKKLAEGLTGLVLDVKRGSGAFLPELDRGLELARTMIELGADRGCPVVALLTAMDRPLGRACGNALEVEESMLALKGEGPPDLMAVTYALGAEMLVLGDAYPTH